MRMIVQRLTERLRDTTGNSRQGIADVLLSLASQLSKSLLGFLSSILLARGLGPGGMGQFALIQSVTDTVVSLSDPGISQTTIRYASKAAAGSDTGGQHAVIRWAFRIRLLLAGGVSALLFFVLPAVAEGFWRNSELTPLLRVGLITAIFLSLGGVPVLYFQSLKRFGMNAFILTAQGVITFGGIAALALAHLLTIERVIVVLAAAAAAAALLACVLLPRKAMLPERLLTRKAFSLRRIWAVPKLEHPASEGLEDAGPERFAFYVFLSTVIVMITLRLDVWLMGVYLEQSQIGLYNVASRSALPLLFVLTALNTALWPRASAATTVLGVQALLRKTLRVSMFVSAAGVVYAIVVPLVIPLVFGEAYAPSVLLAQIVSLGYCIAIMATPMMMVGYSFGMAKVYWVVNLLQMVVVLVLLVVLLPKFGALAAAFAWVANNLVGGLISGYLVLRRSRTLDSGAEKQPAAP